MSDEKVLTKEIAEEFLADEKSNRIWCPGESASHLVGALDPQLQLLDKSAGRR